MKALHLLALGGALLALAATDVQAQIQYEITPFGGGTFFLADPPEQFALGRGAAAPTILHNASFDHAWTLGANAGVRFNNRWAVEAMFSWIPTQIQASSGLTTNEDVNAYMYGLTGLYYLPIGPVVTPFLGLGIGGETFDYSIAGIDSETEFMGNVVGGLYFGVTDQFGVRLEARDCIARFHSGVSGVNNGWENDLMTTVGLSYRFPAD
jgi:opacity protein-like surface antigen